LTSSPKDVLTSAGALAVQGGLVQEACGNPALPGSAPWCDALRAQGSRRARREEIGEL
jgi:hypothetical protein